MLSHLWLFTFHCIVYCTFYCFFVSGHLHNCITLYSNFHINQSTLDHLWITYKLYGTQHIFLIMYKVRVERPAYCFVLCTHLWTNAEYARQNMICLLYLGKVQIYQCFQRQTIFIYQPTVQI